MLPNLFSNIGLNGKILLKPHRLMFSLAIIICAAALIRTLILDSNADFEIAVSSAFYVFASFHMALVLVLLCLGMAFSYGLGTRFQFQYNKWLTLGHIVSIILFLTTLSALITTSSNIPRRYFIVNDAEPWQPVYDRIDFLNLCISISATFTLLFFIVNLMIGYLNKKV